MLTFTESGVIVWTRTGCHRKNPNIHRSLKKENCLREILFAIQDQPSPPSGKTLRQLMQECGLPITAKTFAKYVRILEQRGAVRRHKCPKHRNRLLWLPGDKAA